MNRILKSAILGLAVAATTLSALPAAQAGDGWRRHDNDGWRRHGNDGWRRDRDYGGHHRGSGDLVAAGVLGLAVGALVAGAATANRAPDYYEPVYRQPRPRPHPDRGYIIRDPQVVYAEPVYAEPAYAAVEPWSRAWYNYCEGRYRSFNPRTGTYTGYDGVKRFCEAN